MVVAKRLLCHVAAVSVGIALARPNPSLLAEFALTHASACQPGTGSEGPDDLKLTSGAWSNENDTLNRALYCPMPISSLDELATVALLVDDNNDDATSGNFIAYVCSVGEFDMTAQCGAGYSTTGTFEGYLHVFDLDPLTDVLNGYPYILVTVPNDDATRSRLLGYFASN